MSTHGTSELLNQIGLVLGLFSGLLLIPEVFNLIPVDRLQALIEAGMRRLEHWTEWPLKLGPPSWTFKYTAEERAAIEPTMAVRTLVFSVLWIALLVLGFLKSAPILIALVLLVLAAITLGNMLRHVAMWPRIGAVKLALMFVLLMVILMTVTPLGALMRVVMLLLRLVVLRANGFIARHGAIRRSLIVIAIGAFIASNILQLVSTLDIFHEYSP